MYRRLFIRSRMNTINEILDQPEKLLNSITLHQTASTLFVIKSRDSPQFMDHCLILDKKIGLVIPVQVEINLRDPILRWQRSKMKQS